MNPPFNIQNRFGFSLVEVSIALGICSFSLVSLLGLVPIGISSNRDGVDQTTAACVVSSLVEDFRITPKTMPPSKQTSPQFQVPIPANGSEIHTLFLTQEGHVIGAVDANAIAGERPKYKVSLQFAAPSAVADATKSSHKTATSVRILITWPAMADQAGGTLPTHYSGSYETVIALDRS